MAHIAYGSAGVPLVDATVSMSAQHLALASFQFVLKEEDGELIAVALGHSIRIDLFSVTTAVKRRPSESAGPI